MLVERGKIARNLRNTQRNTPQVGLTRLRLLPRVPRNTFITHGEALKAWGIKRPHGCYHPRRSGSHLFILYVVRYLLFFLLLLRTTGSYSARNVRFWVQDCTHSPLYPLIQALPFMTNHAGEKGLQTNDVDTSSSPHQPPDICNTTGGHRSAPSCRSNECDSIWGYGIPPGHIRHTIFTYNHVRAVHTTVRDCSQTTGTVESPKGVLAIHKLGVLAVSL